MRRYNPKEIEPKWQKIWDETQIYTTTEDPDKPKKYILEYFPYPSANAMHVGHVRNYAIGDAMSRFERMRGSNVLHPMGWDAFGLPAENYAIKTGISPQQAIKENTQKFKQQLAQLGFSYDWSREIDSSDPTYYRWTQWFFKLLFERGLAYQAESLQWWCPVDKTVLANEQVESGKCWRCGNDVIKKPLKQWFFKITDYADRLADDLDTVDWSPALKAMQRNWIGRKTGIDITYQITNVDGDESVTCFTTRPDTNYGATFVVIAPEHPLAQRLIDKSLVPNDGEDQADFIAAYVKKALAKTEIERQEEGRIKTGVFTGLFVTNTLNGRKLPIWISDFVLAGFGTGAVVGVPGHDLRDFEFASTFDLPVVRVVVGADGDTSEITRPEQVQEETGTMVNSEFLDGLHIKDATEKMMDHMEAHGWGKRQVSYHLRDWLISRQRYWGAPIPIVHCPKDGPVAVPDDQLPVVLPEMTSYEPSGDGHSPLARVPEFVNTTCPKCGGPAERETDTMDGFACSSWYFLRFADPHNNERPFDKDKVKFWLPVDNYIGGAEHAVMHLLYARMWTKVIHEAGLIDFDEPFAALRNHGMIIAPNGQKMSKSKGNVIAPDEIIEQGYGADAIRVMELFIGPWNQQAAWSVEGMGGCFRFLQRVWTITQEVIADTSGKAVKPGEAVGRVENQAELETGLQAVTHRAIKRVTKDLETMGYNTAIAALMEFVNDLYKFKTQLPFHAAAQQWHDAVSALNLLLAPFAPHITEELWHDLGHETSIHIAEWPKFDEKLLVEATMTIVVQVNGKVRANIVVDSDASKDDILQQATQDENVQKYLQNKTPDKSIYVPGKLVSFVVKG